MVRLRRQPAAIIASPMARLTTASVSSSVIHSNSPSGPIRKPAGPSPSGHVGGIIFFFGAIGVSPIYSNVLALDPGSGGACGSAGRIGNLFERGANSVVENLVAFSLPYVGDHEQGTGIDI
jgi:hypothetical protein